MKIFYLLIVYLFDFKTLKKKVTSGDCVVIRSVNTKDGKNLEKQIMLSNITAPRLGRRTNPQGPDSAIEPDQVTDLFHLALVSYSKLSYFSFLSRSLLKLANSLEKN